MSQINHNVIRWEPEMIPTKLHVIVERETCSVNARFMYLEFFPNL